MLCCILTSPSLARLVRPMVGSALLVLATLLGGTVASAAPLKVMPLGDSITYGYALPFVPSPGGYREYLYQNLLAAGHPVQFIGTATDNPGPTLTATGQTAHQGHSGWRIDQIDANLDGHRVEDVNGTMQDLGGHFFQRAGNPDIILLHLGTNDILQNYDPEYSGEPGTEDPVTFVSHMADRMDSLLSTIYSNGRDPHVFVGMIPLAWVNSAFAEGRVPLFNAELENRVVSKYQALGHDITYVDLYSPFILQTSTGVFEVNPALYADGGAAIHPNTAGYKVMADAWTQAIVASVPEPSSGLVLAALAGVAALRRRRPGATRPAAAVGAPGAVLLCFGACLAALGPASAEGAVRTFAVGNSLTEDSSLLAMDHMAGQRGRSSISSMHLDYGQTLDQIWKAPTAAESATAPNSPTPVAFPTAFSNPTPWNAIVLQPFHSGLRGNTSDPTDPGDIQRIHDVMKYASGLPGETPPGIDRNQFPGNSGNLNAQYYVFARWSDTGSWSQGVGDPLNHDISYHDAWSRPYGSNPNEPGWPTETADFYNQLMEGVRASQPEGTVPVRLIPTGHVFDAIDVRISEGGLQGLTMPRLYRDTHHLTELGMFVAAATFYATIFEDDPTGIIPDASDYPGLQANLAGRLSSYPELTPATINDLESVIWEVVSTNPYTGMPEPATAGLVLLMGGAVLTMRRRQDHPRTKPGRADVSTRTVSKTP